MSDIFLAQWKSNDNHSILHRIDNDSGIGLRQVGSGAYPQKFKVYGLCK